MCLKYFVIAVPILMVTFFNPLIYFLSIYTYCKGEMLPTPSPDSQLKFYIRIDVPDGQDIICGETKYVIKRDLPPNIRGEIKKLGRLKSISSISSFNRI